MKIREKISNSIVQISIICVYIPIYLQIIYLSLQHKKSPSVLWKVNPGFPYGGIICSKSFVVQRFLQKKENTRFFTKTLSVSKIHTQEEKIKKIEQFMQKEKIHYPIILKPDDGIGGVGVLFIQNKNDLKKNIKNINKDYLVQEYVSRDQELSLFFVKNPQQKKGEIWSITQRKTIKNDKDPELMIPGRKIICTDKSYLITPKIAEIFNNIADIEGFYFGRFDIRTKDIQKFSETGENFTILEVNVGAHSMAIHAFDKKYSRKQRYKIFFNQIKFAFDIADENDHPKHQRSDQNFRDFLKGFFAIFKG